MGAAVRDCGLPREDIWVTSKLWSTNLGYDDALAELQTSYERLGLEYVDLMLLHKYVCDTVCVRACVCVHVCACVCLCVCVCVCV